MLWRISRVAASVIALTSTCAVCAQPKSTSDSLSYAELVLRPDASQIAVVETAHAEDATVPLQNAVAIYDKSGRRLWTFDPCGGCGYTAPDWSPNGQTLAFLGVAD